MWHGSGRVFQGFRVAREMHWNTHPAPEQDPWPRMPERLTYCKNTAHTHGWNNGHNSRTENAGPRKADRIAEEENGTQCGGGQNGHTCTAEREGRAIGRYWCRVMHANANTARTFKPKGTGTSNARRACQRRLVAETTQTWAGSLLNHIGDSSVIAPKCMAAPAAGNSRRMQDCRAKAQGRRCGDGTHSRSNIGSRGPGEW